MAILPKLPLIKEPDLLSLSAAPVDKKQMQGGRRIRENWQDVKNWWLNASDVSKYILAGRTGAGMPTDNDFQYATTAELDKHRADILRAMQAEDKRILNYYELATGQKGDQSVIDKYQQYASDPAMLEMAISKTAVTAPFTPPETPVTGELPGELPESAVERITREVEASFQEKLGRPARPDEIEYFGKQFQQGEMSAYVLKQFLENTTEYQTKTSDVARGKLAGELSAMDEAYLGKVGKQLQARYAAQGRPGAGAFGSALIGAGKELATERTGYLAGLGYQDFQRGQANLRSDYENRLAQMYRQQQQATGLAGESRQRYYATQDWERQLAGQERLARYQQSLQPKPPTFLQQLVPGVIGGAAKLYGSYLGRPTYNF